MLGAILGWADWLDTWLREHLGRPYNAILGLGLGLSISSGVNNLSHSFAHPGNAAAIAGVVAFQSALLLNQLAQLHHFRRETRERRQARRGAHRPR